MASFAELIKSQVTTGGNIETIIRNFNKDSESRKDNVNYFQERLRKLDEEWSTFEKTDNKIRMLEDRPLDHDYFVKDYYTGISDLVQKYKEKFESGMLAVSTKQSTTTPLQPHQQTGAEVNQPVSVEIIKLTRRQAAIMASLERLLGDNFYNNDLPIAQKLWEQIESIHLQIHEACDDPVKAGYNIKRFISLESAMRKIITATMTAESHQKNARTATMQSEAVPMPKIAIPKFDGNHLKWQEFYDLFSSLVINQQLPKTQKIWYLKTHLAGEASNLIKHFSATGDIFDAAWAIVVDRYNNKRLLVSKLVQELVDPQNNGSSDNFKSLHDKTQECLLALQNLDVDTSTWDPLLLNILLKRLDPATCLRYEQSLQQPREVPAISDFLEFLERHFQSMEAIGSKEKSSNNKAKVCTSVTSEGQVDDSCVVCKNGKHPLYSCKKFLQITPAERLQLVQKNKLCCNCMKSGHRSKACTSRSCMKCNKKHNTLLHLESTTKNPEKPATERNSSVVATDTTNAATSLTTSKHSATKNYVFLSTAIIIIKANGTEVSCRAILDSGSQLNFVTERLVKRLGIATKPISLSINGIGSSNAKVQGRVNIALHSRINNFNTRLEAAVLPHIISPQPSQQFNISSWPIPKNIELADPAFNRPDRIDVLLGAEFYHQLLSIGQIKLAHDLPTLQNTVLGWVIGGKIGDAHLSTASCGICTDDEQSLEGAVARLWELDEVKPTGKHLSVQERQCEGHFAQTHQVCDTGRYIVRLPFLDSPDTLGESHGIAFNRFLSFERRLAKFPEIKHQYINFMEEYESLGHMTQINVNAMHKPNYFIPHHCVLRPESLTTKLRVVFDASAKTTAGLSLNDLMHTGPTVQSDLFSILLRFRMPRFVFTTDVEKMYRQMLMHPDDRKLQLIIWRNDPTLPIKYYQLNTITYGTRAAPYLATKCLEQIAKENMTQYPYGAQFLLKNFYVDDGIGGADSLNTALIIQKELTHILNKHGMKLQKWNANNQQLLQNITADESEVNIDFNNETTVKTLGLTWMPKCDKFCVKVRLGEINRITKRTVSSDLARLFDPLGVLAPIIVTAKMFIQELWQLKLTWDEALPAELYTRWINFRKDLEAINNMTFSRHIYKGQVAQKIQIHAFADASEKAYGAAVYIRSIYKDGLIKVRLLCAKSRIAPLKRQTLPRLELCAALLCAELTSRVKCDLNLEDTPTYLWTDSQIVLAWIKSQSSSYHTFVGNRISSIQEITSPAQWHHISSTDNPADILSRGLNPRNLSTCNLWFYGPLFLHGHEDSWPKNHNELTSTTENNQDLERKKAVTMTVAKDENITSNPIYSINHHGSFRTLQRVICYILRFINRTRKREQHSDINPSAQEMDKALVVIIRALQQSDFKDDLLHLKRHNEVAKNSQISNLSPFLDKDGIIRVGGRLESATLSYDAKHQMLLPYHDPITNLVMYTLHHENRHCGPQALLSHIRQRFWPLKGKSLARSVVQHCVRCTKAKPKLLNQVMGNLPSARITPSRPFINSGVDFCGPFWVHFKIRGKKPQKAYIAVFCCFATKAVHFELVSDLTADAFIGSLKRFISRRGHCQHLYCDNATNFVGAKNQLSELSSAIFGSSASEKINKECTSKGITFHFIPPRAPHFGGLWEAAVKSAKHLLLRSVSTASLTFEELETVVIEIEGILNSRPLYPLSENPNDLTALTPGHFLIGEALNAQVDPMSTPLNINLLARWKLVTHLKHEFWRRWSREYLCELQYRNKWKTAKVNIKQGDMVIIKEDNTAPLKWPLGRIINVHPGDDGIVRVVDIKTANGQCRRPIDRVAPLPIYTEETKSDHIIIENEERSKTALIVSIPLDRIQINETIRKKGININQDEHSSTPGKKRRVSINHNFLTVIVALMLLPLVLCATYQNTHFGKQLGIHFEGIGSTVVSPTDWQVLIYYDLEGFWTELSTLSNGTTALRHLCTQIEQQELCMNLVRHFIHTEAELTMDSTLLSGRQKRAALDIVGNIAHSLFGVLDSNYAEEMATTLSRVKENEGHLLNLLKNQTSIIDATINIMKANQKSVKAKFDNIDNQLAQIYTKIGNNTIEQEQERLYRIFSTLSIQLTIIAANLQRTQSSILDVLSTIHHGIISPLLLTPRQLQLEVEKIMFHMPKTLQLPVKQEDALQLYKIMKIKGGLAQNTLIFSITIPLIEPEPFELYNLIAIPNWINNTMLSIDLCSALLAINVGRSQYLSFSEADLNSCAVIREDTYLCSNKQIKYERGSTVCACEISMFYNKTQADCALRPTKDTIVWRPLRHQNQYVYSMPAPMEATIVCNKDITQITIKGSGLLRLAPECILKQNFVSIQAQQTISSSLKTSYSSLWNITQQNHIERVKPLLDRIRTTQYLTQIKNLTELQTSLATQEVLQLPNKVEGHNYHHMTVAYTSLALIVCLFIYIKCTRPRITRSLMQPTPAPRGQIETADFTVHI